MVKENTIVKKSMDFAIRVVRLYKMLSEDKKENIMSKQLLRSGTSIGANVRESVNAQSRNDFISKMNIALKEANEVEYWLELLYSTEYLTLKEYNSIIKDCRAINKILIAIVKTTKAKNNM